MDRSRSRVPIHPLEPSTIELIAAGEVVERPASVVKELVENSLDAGATEIRVALTGGGLQQVEVTDDGEGVPETELDLALTRHATNKITDARDLATVRTLGFRGEALASIASVSRLTLSSRTPDSDFGHGVRMVGGKREERFREGRPVGTSVRVERLFFNTPARRKFLRGAATEALEALRVVEREYLANPRVGFSVVLEGRPQARYPPTSNLKDAASAVLGEEFLEQAIPLEADVGDGSTMDGVVGHPALSRANSLGLYVAVNGRPVEARGTASAIRQAYHDYLPRTRFPVGVVHLRLPPDRLDVNVHPTKREVRLADDRELGESVRRHVREALRRAPELAQPPSRPSVQAEPSGRRPVVPSPAMGALGGQEVSEATPHLAVQRRLPLETTPKSRPPRPARLELIGPLFQLYWVASTSEGLILIDQHAASERLLFDAIRRDGHLAQQALVDPVRVELTSRQRAALDAHGDAVRAAGFTVESFGGGAFRVSSVPVFHGSSPRAEAVLELLDELAAGGRPTIPNGFIDRRAASIACHAAVRAGDSISVEMMQRILDGLSENPEGAYACPHGRPIRVLLPRGRLDQWFLRSGP